jgi:hypothetical protein
MQGAVSVRRVTDDKEIASLTPTGAETWAMFSRDDKFLAVLSHYRSFRCRRPPGAEHAADRECLAVRRSNQGEMT